MKNGKVFDTDTHVLPAAEIIERYVDPDFRPRLKELEPYRTPMRQSAEYQGARCMAIASSHNPIAGCSARRPRGPTTAAATRSGWARRCRVQACRTTTPATASPTW